MTYRTAIIKTYVERAIMYPFVLMGKLLSPLIFVKTKHSFIIFSASADIGGSVRVNIDLCECFADKSPLVIFSKTPKNNQFLPLFEKTGAHIVDLHRYVDYKSYHFVNFFFRGAIAAYINKLDNPVVVGGESLFFYKVLPFIKPSAIRVDVCHLNTWFNYTQAFIKNLDARVFSTKKIQNDAILLYKKNNLPEKYFAKLHFIDNKVDIPLYQRQKGGTLSVVYVGRGAPQKRVHLIAAIAKKLHESQANVHFSFVGDVEKVFDPADYPYCTFYGNVYDKSKVEGIYRSSDVLLLTSAYEGLPIAIMQMMAYGKVVVSTAVDSIPDYITDNETGFLLKNHADEKEIIEEGISVLTNLNENRDLLEKVGEKSRLYAEQHFSGETFCREYSIVLFERIKVS